MGMQHEFRRDYLLQPQFDLERRVARRQSGAVADAEHMGIDRHGVLAKGHVEHDIGGLAPDAGQRLHLGAGARHLAAEFGDQLFRQRDDVPGLVAIEPDGLDVLAHFLFAELQHFRGVSATANSARVALLTPASVACAESTTATNSV